MAKNITTRPTETARTYDEIDGQNRQFVWVAYDDGSAASIELTHHRSDPALRTKETWRDSHPAGSDTARMIQCMGR